MRKNYIIKKTCRTGLGPNSNMFSLDAQNSLAQLMSNQTQAPVKASFRRTDYSDTLGTVWQRNVERWPNANQIEIGGGIFTPYGAMNSVGTGSSPLYAPSGYYIFYPH